MKTSVVIPFPVRGVPAKSRVKITLLMGIIYLISDYFIIFVNVVASIMAYYGVIVADSRIDR